MREVVRVVFDLRPEEKDRLERICTQLGITKIEFLRRAMDRAEIEEEPD